MSQIENLYHFLSILVTYVGGGNNIREYSNCMTRLHIELKEDSLSRMEEVDTTTLPYRLFIKEKQLQVILGPDLACLAIDLLDQILQNNR